MKNNQSFLESFVNKRVTIFHPGLTITGKLQKDAEYFYISYVNLDEINLYIRFTATQVESAVDGVIILKEIL